MVLIIYWLATIVFLGIIRAVFAPWRGFGFFIIELLFIDLLSDLLGWLIDVAHDVLD